MRILITGASGLLGLNLALVAAGGWQADEMSPTAASGGPGHTVFGVANQPPLQTELFHYILADLLAPDELERLLDLVQPDWIIHCAALAEVDACESHPDLAHKLNTELPRKLASLVARGGARLLHVSTDAVFDGQRGNYTEQDAPHPLSVYARTKLAGELAVAEADPGALIVRVNMYGWSMSGTRSLAEFFINNLQAGKPVKGFMDVFFSPLLVNDLGWIFLCMLESQLHGLYHVVSPVGVSKYDFGVALARQFGLDEKLISAVKVAEAGLTAMRSPNLTLKTDKLAKDLGSPLPTWKDGFALFYHQYQRGYPQYLQSLRS